MIRFRSGHIPTTQELRDGLKGRVAITDFPRRKAKPVTPMCRECDRPAKPKTYGHYCSRACLKAADL